MIPYVIAVIQAFKNAGRLATETLNCSPDVNTRRLFGSIEEETLTVHSQRPLSHDVVVE